MVHCIDVSRARGSAGKSRGGLMLFITLGASYYFNSSKQCCRLH